MLETTFFLRYQWIENTGTTSFLSIMVIITQTQASSKLDDSGSRSGTPIQLRVSVVVQ